MSAASDKLRQEADRADLLAALTEIGLEPEWVAAQSRDLSDYAPLPPAKMHRLGVWIRESKIQGLGMFARREFHPGEVIMLARINGKRTQAGRYPNHSRDPNAVMVRTSFEAIALVALRWIVKGDEICNSYRDTRHLLRFDGLCDHADDAGLRCMYERGHAGPHLTGKRDA